MGKRLARIRKDSGLNQVPFAEALEISQSAYTTYERGQREMPARLLRILHDKFNVNPAWMITGEGQTYNPEQSDLHLAIVASVDRFLLREGSEVSDDKRKRLIQFLVDFAEQHGEFTEEIAEKYLRSAI
jgi:transcriptional regulator with XRE-family HTH domain